MYLVSGASKFPVPSLEILTALAPLGNVTYVAQSYLEGQTLSAARERVGTQIDSTRQAVELKRRQVSNAVDAGRAAAQQARVELEQRIAETKAAYKES